MNHLKDLVSILHKSDTQPLKGNAEVTAIEVSPNPVDGYVWPALCNWKEEKSAGVVLIEAAGAVGKSAAATALASELNWPLVNAAKAQVGSYSLSGLIHDALGFESTFLSDVARASAGIVIDALDEAHLRAGTLNFHAFMDNVRKLAGTDHEAPSIVILSRPDTAQLIRLFFSEWNCPLSSATIDFFDREQTHAFINSYLKGQYHRHPDRFYGVADQHPIPFSEMRDASIHEIASALLSKPVSNEDLDWQDVRSFLGYAPVLAVLSEYLAVPNPRKYQIAGIGSISNPAEILLKIIENLLIREQEKFQSQIKVKLIATMPTMDEWDDFDSIYSPDEQGLRLVARNRGLRFKVQVPASLPIAIRQDYEEAADQFVSDHPFMAGGRSAVNVVFADYIQAKAAVDTQCLAALTPSSRVNLGPVGPFFYQFVYEFGSKPENQGARINEDLVAPLIDSFVQSSAAFGPNFVMYYQNDYEAQLVLPSKIAGQTSSVREFQVTDLSGLIEIPEKLTRVIIVTDAAVRISSKYGKFILGPFVQIVCDDLVIAVDSISVDPGHLKTDIPTSIIRANKIESGKHFTVDCPNPDAFKVIGRHTISSLIPYIADRTPARVVAYEEFLTLRSILKRFGQAAGPLPSVYGDLMEQRVIKDNAERKFYLRRLIELGVVSVDQHHYNLHTSILSKYGINLQSILNSEPSDSVLDFIFLLKAEEVRDSQ